MQSVTRRQVLLSLAGGAFALPIARTEARDARQSVELLQYAWSDSGVPNPFQVSPAGPGGPILVSLIFDTLTWKDDKGIIPWLASEWSISSDGLTYTFRIVSGATWQDGKPLTADDVAFSFAYYARHSYVWMRSDVVESATAEGDTVRIILNRPYAAFIEDVTGIVPIIPKHVWESVDDPILYAGSDRSLGSGPYVLAEYNDTAGAYRLTANDAYWNGTLKIAELRQLVIPPEALIQSVREGGVDLASSPDASVRDLLEDDRDLAVHESAPLSIVRLAVNTTQSPLDRVEVRQAIAFALDRKLIAETITRGPAIVGSAGVVPPETPWFNPGLPQYTYDPERARDLLGGERLLMNLVADVRAREPDLMIPMLEAVGITLNVQRVDPATRVQLLRDGDFQLGLLTHIGVGGDPDYLRRWYSGEETNAFAQGSLFSSEEYTRLAKEQAASLDMRERKDLIFRMQEILAEELPTIVLYHRRFYWIYDPIRFTPMKTWGGLMNGIPFPHNKLAFLAR
ncbi:MAG TPA: ABC transporter substrate-binding protein [Thermomicrobiales bacterium]|nr:ABC transporter substrate-binding protein [Thermomicrobiales bacterium]